MIKNKVFFLFGMLLVVQSIAAGSKKLKDSKLPVREKLPIVFHPKYDISFFGIEKLHSFDSKKYGKVMDYLLKNIPNISIKNFQQPRQAISKQDLLKVHTPKYLKSLKSSKVVAKIAEVPVLRILPNFLVKSRLLSPMRYATQGTVDAAQLALKTGVAINLGGGYHHAQSESGGGFCVYADIPLAMLKLREQNPHLKIMYIDLDAHQGNGVESFFVDQNDRNTFIVDCYDQNNYPNERVIRNNKPYYIPAYGYTVINKKILHENINCDEHKATFCRKGHSCQACNDAYLKALKATLKEVLAEFQPDFIFYNAGTDCFEEDRIGGMALTKQGIIDRDQIMFEFAKELNAPICMTLSGGYSKKSADIIGSSIVNLYNKKLLKPVSRKNDAEGYCPWPAGPTRWPE
jgi:histone deacetylase 11